jgi:dTDP-4-dehydrorhamnose reductase
MANLRKVLLLGGCGFVGRAVARRFGVERVAASYHRPPSAGADRWPPGSFRFDAATQDLLEVVPDLSPYSHAVVLLGDTKLNSCFNDQAKSYALNVVGIRRVLDRLREHDVFPVFTSTEAVFDGRRGNYDESDAPNPLNVYGRQKVEVERYLIDHFTDSLVLRLAMVYGDAPGDGSLPTDWAGKLHRGEPFTCAHDNRCSPIHVDDCAASIAALIERGCRGIYHVAGTRAVSRCEIADLLIDEAVRCGSKPPDVKRCSIDDFKLPEPRPHDVSLNAAKCIAATGVVPRDVADACRTLIRRTFGVE